jgi:hypothetical protein
MQNGRALAHAQMTHRVQKKMHETAWLAAEELVSHKYFGCTQLVEVTDNYIDDFMKAETRRCT